MLGDTAGMTAEINEDEKNMVPIRYLELDGERKEIHSCYGDIIIIINAMADYAGLLDDYRMMYPEGLNAFQAATYEYQANRYRKIQKSLEQQMGYDRDKAFEKCQKRRAKHSSDDVGEEALVLLARKKANEERKKEEARNPSEHVKEKEKTGELEGQLSFLRKRRDMERFLKTAWWCFALNIVWKGLELLLYREIQPRRVDDIMFFLYVPFIWMAMR